MKKKQNKSATNRKRSGAATGGGRIIESSAPAEFATPGLPTLTCASIVGEDRALHFSPYGRTYPRDLILHHLPVVSKELNLLVFQCGDLRDVARTLSDAKRK
ncbi:hypothetical protein H9P43_009723 [Blastocladiella emersonii ATCC 22665]|nr:hypothetical protein H9P43_009723 [Blastocladiella emersonii ATCC 22665]